MIREFTQQPIMNGDVVEWLDAAALDTPKSFTLPLNLQYRAIVLSVVLAQDSASEVQVAFADRAQGGAGNAVRQAQTVADGGGVNLTDASPYRKAVSASGGFSFERSVEGVAELDVTVSSTDGTSSDTATVVVIGLRK